MKFSQRTDWSLDKNTLTQLKDQLIDEGQDIINLAEGNPTKCGFDYPLDLLDSFKNEKNFSYQPVSAGLVSVRESVREYYQKRNIDVNVDQIILTASTSEAYTFLFRLLCDAGDNVLFPRPSYPLFQFLADLNDVQSGHYDLIYHDEKGWKIDFDSLENSINEKTKAIVLVHPNNPTGSYTSESELKKLNQLAEKYELSLIVDEVFLDYSFNNHSSKSLLENNRVLTFVMSGLSKLLGMPQMKLAWIAVNGPETFCRQSLDRLDVIADTYLSVSTPIQNAASDWLARIDFFQSQIQNRIQKNLNFFKSIFGNQVLCLEGGWYAILKLKNGLSDEEFVLKSLKEKKVYLHPGYFFDLNQENCVVLSLLPEFDIFKKGIERIAEI